MRSNANSELFPSNKQYSYRLNIAANIQRKNKQTNKQTNMSVQITPTGRNDDLNGDTSSGLQKLVSKSNFIEPKKKKPHHQDPRRHRLEGAGFASVAPPP